MLKVEKAAAGEECKLVVTGLLSGIVEPLRPGVPLASDLNHVDKAYADSGRQDRAKRLKYMCH